MTLPFPNSGPNPRPNSNLEPGPGTRRALLRLIAGSAACLLGWSVAGRAAALSTPGSGQGTAQDASGATGRDGRRSDSVQGKLVNGQDGTLRVATPSGEVAVTSSDSSILHTLQDPRMNGREVRLEGRRDSASALDVAHVFTVRDGRVFRLRFYCHVCNIPATEPGPCVCCQRWTDLEEIPLDQVTDDMVLVP